MADDSQSTSKSKNDEKTNSKGRNLNGNSSTSKSEAVDAPGPRRSTRESSLKKQMPPSPASTRKSERLEKQTPATPPVKKKSMIVKKHMPNPLRRSERGKKQSPSTSLGSKKSEKSSASSDAKKIKEKKAKTVKQLTIETREIKESEKKDTKPARMSKKKNWNAHAYRALFVQNTANNVSATDKRKELSRLDKTDSEMSIGRNSKQVDKNDMVETSDDENGAGMSTSSTKLIHGMKVLEAEDGDGLQVSKSDDSARVDCPIINKTGSSELVESTSIDMIDDAQNGSVASHKVASFKRKRDVDMEPKGKRTETCATCLKRQRLDSVSLDQELCSCKKYLDHSEAAIAEDRGRLEDEVTTAVVQICSSNSQPPVDIQTDGDQNICKLDGVLLSCNGKGCKQRYHLSCLDSCLDNVPLGVWHCLGCIEKKIEYGVHTISEVESVWDAKELDVLDTAGGSQKQKHFFVKYKGFAHAHNCWVLESQLLLEAPQLVAKFNQESLVAKWKQEWVVPQRLLWKRLLMPSKQNGKGHSGSAAGTLVCQYEWLVKWRGLGYEDATWELENAPFLNSPEGQSLISDYESRHMKAKKDSLSRVDKRADRKGRSLTKLSHLPVGGPPILDNINILDTINKLREFLQKGQNAVIIDDPERILKVIMFLISLQLDPHRPFLIITSSDMIYSWESEFSRLAPSVNVVVYSGNKDLRKFIRSLEFLEEGGHVMFEVLVSTIEVIVEDLEVLDCIGWEGIIVDDCQHSQICTHFEQIKMLTSDMRLLLVSSQLKDTATEYLKILSFLDYSTNNLCNTDGSRISYDDNCSKLKEKLSRYIANDDKDISRFVEYLVPVRLSNIQLEQYCATLLSNSLSLQSLSKNDPFGALHDILISIRKCCDHPYILDPSLQGSLTKGLQGVEILDIGIKASGKLQLLELMLMEIKDKGLRVLILYQTIYASGGGRESTSIGDILDDFMRQKFGIDSYERVDGLGASAKSRLAALNKFNDKESKRFVFLLETRACLPSIRLSSVDTAIIFGSDWNPVNDIKALQKITIDSQSKQVKLFRLYSSYTVEEKVLMLEKHEMIRDSNVQSGTTVHKLLMWGSSYLFSKLDEFHGCSTAGTTTEHTLFRNVLQEFSTILGQSDTIISGSELILKVKHNGLTYHGSFSLAGKREIQSSDKLPPVFWKKLLEGKDPQWRHQLTKSSSLRNRKRVQYFNELPDKLEVVNEGAAKKRKIMVSDSTDLPTLNPEQDEGKVAAGRKEGVSRIPVNNEHEYLSPTSHIECYGGSKVYDAQKSLYLLLKPKVSRLCETLQLSEDIKDMVEKFLEYVMKNHSVSKEPLQAFQISLCWIAASLLKKKIDQKQSLVLAKQHLNFSCDEEEANYVYLKLRCLKHTFMYRTGCLKIANSPRASSMSSKDEPSGKSNSSNNQQEDIVDQSLSIQILVERDISVSMKRLQKKCDKQLSKLAFKEREEVNELYRIYEEEKAELEKKQRTELAFIRCLERSSADKSKMLETDFAGKVEQHKQQLNTRLEDLRKMQFSAREKLEQKFTHMKDGIMSWSRVELLDRLLSGESGCLLECPRTSDQGVQDDNENDCLEKQSPCRSVHGLPTEMVNPIEIPEVSREQIRAAIQPDSSCHSSCHNTEKVLSVTPLSPEDRTPVATMLSISHGDVSHEVLGTGDGMASNRRNDTTIDQGNGEDGIINQDSHLQELNPGNAHLVQSECTDVSDGNHEDSAIETLHDQELQDHCSLPLMSADKQGGDAPSSKQGGGTQGEAPLSHPNSDHVPNACNFEALTSDPITQSQLSPTDTSSYENPLDLSSAGEIGDLPCTEEQIGTCNDASRRRIHEAPDREPVVQLQFSAPMDSSSGHNPLLTSRSLVDNPQRRQIQTTHTVSQMPLPSSLDPLQNELEKIRKDIDHSGKIHEDMKRQLKADCEKEILEVIAQIRKKYEIKLQETEGEYSLKKKEMDATHNKVLMNKILAEAFRCKCMDGRASGRQGMQQDIVSSSRQQVVQSQQTGQRQPFVSGSPVTSTPRPPAAASPRPSTLPAASPRPSTLPAAASPRPSTLPAASPRPSTLPAASPHAIASPHRPVYHSRPSANLPVISPLASPHPTVSRQVGSEIRAPAPHLQSAASRQGGSEIRAPAPHLQRFRPPPSLSSSSGIPSQQPPNNTAISPLTSLPPLPPRIPIHQAVNTASSFTTPLLPRMPSHQTVNTASSPTMPLPPRMPSQQVVITASSPTMPISPRMPSQHAGNTASSSTTPLPPRMPSQQAVNATSASTTPLPPRMPSQHTVNTASASTTPLPPRMPSQQAVHTASSTTPESLRMPSQETVHTASSLTTPLSSTNLPPVPHMMPTPNNASSPILSSTSLPPLPDTVSSQQAPNTNTSSPLSALELLIDVDRQYGATLPDILSPLPDLGSNLDRVNHSALGLRGSNVDARVANNALSPTLTSTSLPPLPSRVPSQQAPNDHTSNPSPSLEQLIDGLQVDLTGFGLLGSNIDAQLPASDGIVCLSDDD